VIEQGRVVEVGGVLAVFAGITIACPGLYGALFNRT